MTDSLDKGIEEITKVVVDDKYGYQGTQSFEDGEKKAILNHLANNEEYMSLSREVLVD